MSHQGDWTEFDKLANKGQSTYDAWIAAHPWRTRIANGLGVLAGWLEILNWPQAATMRLMRRIYHPWAP